jgi:hypothetical protein
VDRSLPAGVFFSSQRLWPKCQFREPSRRNPNHRARRRPILPFAITVRVGQPVIWINNDTDDQTVVSNDAFDTAGHRGVNVTLKASGGTFTLVFKHPGVFPFYCRFHSMLDADHQPKAPGPDGGIQDSNGNYGTPMNGVITVLGDD